MRARRYPFPHNGSLPILPRVSSANLRYDIVWVPPWGFDTLKP
jgi:hypothetical protein